MSKNHSIPIRILSILTLAAFIATQCGQGYAMRAEAADQSKATGEIANALGAAGRARADGDQTKRVIEIGTNKKYNIEVPAGYYIIPSSPVFDESGNFEEQYEYLSHQVARAKELGLIPFLATRDHHPSLPFLKAVEAANPEKPRPKTVSYDYHSDVYMPLLAPPFCRESFWRYGIETNKITGEDLVLASDQFYKYMKYAIENNIDISVLVHNLQNENVPYVFYVKADGSKISFPMTFVYLLKNRIQISGSELDSGMLDKSRPVFVSYDTDAELTSAQLVTNGEVLKGHEIAAVHLCEEPTQDFNFSSEAVTNFLVQIAASKASAAGRARAVGGGVVNTANDRITLRHSNSFAEASLILKYGFWSAVGMTTFSSARNNKYSANSEITIVYKAPLRLVMPSSSGLPNLWCLSEFAQVEGRLPDELARVLENIAPGNDLLKYNERAKNGLCKLGMLPVDAIDVDKTLEENEELVKRGILSRAGNSLVINASAVGGQPVVARADGTRISSVRVNALLGMLEVAKLGLTPPIKSIKLANLPDNVVDPVMLADLRGFERLTQDLLSEINSGGAIEIFHRADISSTVEVEQEYMGNDLLEEVAQALARKDYERLRLVGHNAGNLLAQLHLAKILADDSHPKNFVVDKEGKVYRIDLKGVLVYSDEIYNKYLTYNISERGLQISNINKGPLPFKWAKDEIENILFFNKKMSDDLTFAKAFLESYLALIKDVYPDVAKYVRGILKLISPETISKDSDFAAAAASGQPVEAKAGGIDEWTNTTTMEEKLRDIESALTYENDPEKRAAVWAMLMSFASYQDLGMFYQTHKVIEHAMIYLAADLQHEDDRVVWSAECALAVIASNPNLTELASVRDGIKNAIPLLENNTRRQLGHYNVPLSAHLALQSISRNPKLSSVDTASAAGQAQATGTFVAVVIDADSNDRAQLTKRIEDSGQFDEVLSAESEEAAQRLITAKQDVLYDTETRFIKIQVTGKTLTLSTNGFEPKILDPHLDINDAIKAYLQDV